MKCDVKSIKTTVIQRFSDFCVSAKMQRIYVKPVLYAAWAFCRFGRFVQLRGDAVM